MKLIKLTLPLLIALAYAPAQATSLSDLLNFKGLTVFADTYIGGGADVSDAGNRTSVYGSILSGDVATFGNGSSVTGNFESVGAANISSRVVGGVHNTSVGGNVTAGGVTTLADGGIINGYIISGDTATTGANTYVKGNISSAGVLTVGGTSSVGGNISSGGTATVSATSTVTGTVTAVGVITIGTPNSTGAVSHIDTSPVNTNSLVANIHKDVNGVATQVQNAQNAASAMGTGEVLDAVIGSRTFTPGVYSAASWSPTAGSIFTLDAGGKDNQTFVFNMTDILVFGAGTQIVMKNAGKNDTVVWNVTNGYAAVSANATVLGTILADTYISVGAGATVTGVDAFSCGGVYSQTSYVSTGDGASIGGGGCSASSISAVPEPTSYAMMLAGLGLLGFAVSRKKQA